MSGLRALVLATSFAPERRPPELRPPEYPRTEYVELAKLLDSEIMDYELYADSRLGSAMRILDKKPRLDFLLALTGYRKAREFDVVLLMSERVAIPYTLLCRVFGKRARTFTISMHSSMRQARLVSKLGLAALFDGVVSLTPAQEEFLTREMDIARERISYVPYAVDEEFFSPTGQGKENGLMTAGGVPGRDYGTFVAALRDCEYPVTMVVGGRSYGRHTANPIANLPDSFSVLSGVHSEEMRTLYRRSAVVVVPLAPGRADAAGSSVLLEAMCSGSAAVVSDTPGIAAYVENGRDALLVEPGNPRALREVVDKLMRDSQLRQEIEKNARNRVESHFTLGQYVASLRDVIEGNRVGWPGICASEKGGARA